MNSQMGESNPQLRTMYCGNLDDQVDEDLLYELFLQAGPLEKVHIPRDRNGSKSGYSFITFKHECSVPYAIELFEDTSLYGRFPKLRARHGSAHQRSQSLPVNFNQNATASMNFDGLLKMSQNLLRPQGPSPLVPLLMGMPMPPGVEMPPPPGVEMPLPPGVEMPPGVGVPMGMGMEMGMPMGPNVPPGMPYGMAPPMAPSGFMPHHSQQWSHESSGRDFNGSKMDRNFLSQSSLQGNWSARNSSHMLPVDDSRRPGHHSRRDREYESDHKDRSYRDRDGHRSSGRGSSSDYSEDRYDHYDSHYSRDRSNNDRKRDRDDRNDYRRRSSGNILERRGRY